MKYAKSYSYIVLVLLLCEYACLAKRDYEKACNEDSIKAYETYLETHHNEKYTKKALKRLEERSFEKARKEDTYAAYAGFIERFPFGNSAKEAERRAEDIRAKEMGITLYRNLPEDYYPIITATELPYRIMIMAKREKGRNRESEIRWFEEFKSREVFVPMDPRKIYNVRPDILLILRESIMEFYSFSWALVDAEVWARNTLIKQYKIAGDRIERYLLYEMCKDERRYNSVFRISKRETESLMNDFQQALRELPVRGSLAIEYELRSMGSQWDHAFIQEFLGFLNSHPLCENFYTYERGHPPQGIYAQRAFISVNPETHIPVFRISRQSLGEFEGTDWSTWNSKWILVQKDYFFKKMYLDILNALVAKGALSYYSKGGRGVSK